MDKRRVPWLSSGRRTNAMVWTAVTPSIVAVVAALVVLALALRLYLHRSTRGSLKRQSLQVLISVQLMSLIYSGSYM
jgi:hypothetical protein